MLLTQQLLQIEANRDQVMNQSSDRQYHLQSAVQDAQDQVMRLELDKNALTDKYNVIVSEKEALGSEHESALNQVKSLQASLDSTLQNVARIDESRTQLGEVLFFA